MKRPSPESIRKAFAEHLTVDVDGYEQTVWDILHWTGIMDVFLFLQDYVHEGETVGVNVDYEHMSLHNLEDSIKISEINRELRKYKSAKLNTSKYQEIYADRSKLILAYKSFAKEILKDELKLSDDEIKDLQFTQEYQKQQQGLEFEIMYKLAYQYQKEMDQTK